MNKRLINITKRAMAAVTAMSVVGTMATDVYAAENEDGKEEVVYISTDECGNVTDVNVVNIFDGGDVTDYGDYSTVQILNTTDEISSEDGKQTFSSSARRVYYQGNMGDDTEIPWNISIKYELDGEEISPDELGGKSGALKIHFVVDENKSCRGSFYDDYALQAAFTLDTGKCTNIVTDGATLANVGSDLQISYTILPGNGIDTYITADVEDFEMDAVAINGVQLSLSVDIDDEELTEKVGEIMDATEQLNSGAVTLYDGAVSLIDGADSLNQGMQGLKSGVTELDNGIFFLQTGMSNMNTGLNSLNSQSESLTTGSAEFKTALTDVQTALSEISITTEQLTALTDASGDIKDGIDSLCTGVATFKSSLGYEQYKNAVLAGSDGALDIDALVSNNTATINNLTSQVTALQESIAKIKATEGYAQSTELQTQAAGLESQVSSLSQMIVLLNGNNAAIGGVDTYLTGLTDGLADIEDGLLDLQTNYATFDEAINTLATNLSGFAVGMTNLTDAINTLVTEYTKLDDGIVSYTDGVASVVAGYQQLLAGVSSLANGSKSLLDGSGQLQAGTYALYDGLETYCEGSLEMVDGTQEFNENAGNMQEELETKIDDIMSVIGGEEKEVKSFVSSKNTNVKSVQFVIKTDEITAPEEEKAVVEENKESKSFIDKFLELF